jgi:hypothetical protein
MTTVGCPFLLLLILCFNLIDVFPPFRRLMKLLILLTIQNVFCDALFCDAAIVCNCTVFPLSGDWWDDSHCWQFRMCFVMPCFVTQPLCVTAPFFHFQEIDEMIHTVDKNGDGKISFSEFRWVKDKMAFSGLGFAPEYWMIYRGPVFLAVWFGSSSTLSRQ